MSKMLPCPFCGDDKIEVRENGSFWIGTRSIPVSYEVIHWCPALKGDVLNGPIRMISRSKEGAIDRWNRRAP